MAKINTKDLKGYFFLALGDGQINTIYENHDDNAALAAAFAGAMLEDAQLFDILSAAFVTVLDDRKEKYNSKKSNKVQKKPAKSKKEK